MIQGGTGGSKTTTGLAFENNMELKDALLAKGFILGPLKIKDYSPKTKKLPMEVRLNGELIGLYLPGSSLYAYLKSLKVANLAATTKTKKDLLAALKDDRASSLRLKGLDETQISQILNDKAGWRGPLSSRLIPDEAFLNVTSNTLHIIEKKMQTVSGSVDEKLQTFDFKRTQYASLLKPFEIELKYVYVLSHWFKQPRYFDVLLYMTENKQEYWIQEHPEDFTIDMGIIGL